MSDNNLTTEDIEELIYNIPSDNESIDGLDDDNENSPRDFDNQVGLGCHLYDELPAPDTIDFTFDEMPEPYRPVEDIVCDTIENTDVSCNDPILHPIVINVPSAETSNGAGTTPQSGIMDGPPDPTLATHIICPSSSTTFIVSPSSSGTSSVRASKRHRLDTHSPSPKRQNLNKPNLRTGPTYNKTSTTSPSGIMDGPSGPTQLIYNLETKEPVDLFRQFFDSSVIDNITFQTNLYCQQSGKRFTPTTNTEVETFLGINILMGIKKLPSYRDYWSSDEDLHDPYISKLMPLTRFSWMLGNLHINDNSIMPGRNTPEFDKLYKIRPLLDALAVNFDKNFNPGPILAIDESMIKFKGRSSLKQYLPKKPVKRGYKLWMLADKSGYCLRFQLYTGKSGPQVEVNLGERVVKELTSKLKGKHHTLYIDNYFVGYFLIEDLKQDKINACGTVNAGRKFLPQFKDTKTMNRGEYDYFTSTTGVSAIKWIDNKAVLVLTNCHDPRETVSVKRKQKSGERINVACPLAISDYNNHMNCVDRFDQMKEVYEIDRKSKKWWHRIFFYFVDACVVNAFVLHKCLPVNRFEMKDFRRKIVHGLVSQRKTEVETNISKKPVPFNSSKPQVPLEVRESGSNHQPARTTRRRCAACSTKKKPVQTMWMCSICKVPLCLGKTKTCFQEYHGKKV